MASFRDISPAFRVYGRLHQPGCVLEWVWRTVATVHNGEQRSRRFTEKAQICLQAAEIDQGSQSAYLRASLVLVSSTSLNWGKPRLVGEAHPVDRVWAEHSAAPYPSALLALPFDQYGSWSSPRRAPGHRCACEAASTKLCRAESSWRPVGPGSAHHATST